MDVYPLQNSNSLFATAIAVEGRMTTMVAESRRTFVPGMGVEWLLPLYDPLTKLIGLDRVRRELIERAGLQPRQRVLDVGCGTGTLALLIKRLFPDVDVVGRDPDQKALARAGRKAQRAGVSISFELGFSDALHYPAASFDQVFSSFMFHHLGRAEKDGTLREIRRVLRPGGRLQLLDFDGPESGQKPHRSRLHIHRRLSDNAEATVLTLMTGAGLTNARTTARPAVLGGSVRMVHYTAEKLPS
jgi:SAM-dependent methyltransferase